jgi:hypothetical protein
MTSPIETQASEIIQAMRDTVPVVTESLVQLTYAQGVGKLVLGGVAFTILLLAQFFFWKVFGLVAEKTPKRNYTDSESGAILFGWMVSAFVSLVALLTATSYLYDGLIYVIAPEGQTIMNVLKAMRGVVE